MCLWKILSIKKTKKFPVFLSFVQQKWSSFSLKSVFCQLFVLIFIVENVLFHWARYYYYWFVLLQIIIVKVKTIRQSNIWVGMGLLCFIGNKESVSKLNLLLEHIWATRQFNMFHSIKQQNNKQWNNSILLKAIIKYTSNILINVLDIN